MSERQHILRHLELHGPALMRDICTAYGVSDRLDRDYYYAAADYLKNKGDILGIRFSRWTVWYLPEHAGVYFLPVRLPVPKATSRREYMRVYMRQWRKGRKRGRPGTWDEENLTQRWAEREKARSEPRASSTSTPAPR